MVDGYARIGDLMAGKNPIPLRPHVDVAAAGCDCSACYGMEPGVPFFPFPWDEVGFAE